MRSLVTASVGGWLLGLVGLVFVVAACSEVTALIGPVSGLSGLPGVSGSPPLPADFPIPQGAVRYRTYLIQAWQYHFAMAEDPAIGFGQVHQESRFDCSAVSAGGSVGCGQFRPATAAEVNQWIPAKIRATCPVASGCPLDPKWALTALVEYDFHLWSGVLRVATPRERWAFTLSAYNGGGAVTGAERAACARSRDCDPTRYFHNVERFCGSFGRSDASCRENREYPHVILDTWAPGYHRWLQG